MTLEKTMNTLKNANRQDYERIVKASGLEESELIELCQECMRQEELHEEDLRLWNDYHIMANVIESLESMRDVIEEETGILF